MNSNDKYSILVEINVKHDFFGDSAIPIQVVFDNLEVQRRYRLTIKRNRNSWILYGSTTDISCLREDLSVIRLKIIPTEPIFYFVSKELDNSLNEFTIISDDLNKTIEIATNIEHLIVLVASKSKYLEYILFLENISEDKEVEIIDTKKLIEFELPQKIQWDDNKKALRCVSKDKITLTKKMDYQLNIIEKSKYGNRIVLNNIIIPKPQSASIHDPYQSITAFYTI